MNYGTALDHRVQDHNLNCYIINLVCRVHCHAKANFPQHLIAKHSLYTIQIQQKSSMLFV